MYLIADNLGSPSPPINLSANLIDENAVRLEWEAPLDDGGVAIASYQVSVMDMVIAVVVRAGTTAILTLNSTGEHHVEIIALNTCNRISQPVLIIFNTTSIESTTTSSASMPTNTQTTPSFSSTTNTETNIPATSESHRFIVLA